MSILRHGRHWFAATAMLAMLAGLAPALVSGQTTDFEISLSSAEEVPPTSSTATGSFSATLDEDAETLTWSLNVPSITDATMAHIHMGAAGANGAIVVTLLMTADSPVGSISESGTAGPDDLEGPLAGDWAGFVEALQSGGLYVNVHTTANPAGEIRGQLTAEDGGTPTATATATGTATATATATATPTRTATATPAPTRTAMPAPPKTGQAGLVDDSDNAGVAVLLIVVAVGVVAGTRLLTNRNR